MTYRMLALITYPIYVHIVVSFTCRSSYFSCLTSSFVHLTFAAEDDASGHSSSPSSSLFETVALVQREWTSELIPDSGARVLI